MKNKESETFLEACVMVLNPLKRTALAVEWKGATGCQRSPEFLYSHVK